MPGNLSGLEVAEKLRKGGAETIIIFVTAHEQYVFSSLDYQPFHYIRKNHMNTELPIVLKAAFRAIAAKADREITVKTDVDKVRRVAISEIVYYEVFDRKIAIYLNNGAEVVTLRMSIKDMQELIPEKRFILIHRNCVVNADYIKNIGDCSVALDDGNELVVSRARMKVVSEQLLSFWGDLI
jgi:DNA-binding LytR/AlgR family response regulator